MASGVANTPVAGLSYLLTAFSKSGGNTSPSNALQILAAATEAHLALSSPAAAVLYSTSNYRQLLLSLQSAASCAIIVGGKKDADVLPLFSIVAAMALVSGPLCATVFAGIGSKSSGAAKKGSSSSVALFDGNGDHQSSSGGGGVDSGATRELSNMAARFLKELLAGIRATATGAAVALGAGNASDEKGWYPALLMCLETLVSSIPNNALAFRGSYALDMLGDMLALAELASTSRNSHPVHEALAEGVAACLRLLAFARWPDSATFAAAGGAGGGATGGVASSTSDDSSGGGSRPYRSRVSPFVSKLLLLIDGDASLIMTVRSGSPYVLPSAASVAQMLASCAPDYNALLAQSSSASASAAAVTSASASSSAESTNDAAAITQLRGRIVLVLKALRMLVKPVVPCHGRALTEDASSFYGFSLPSACAFPLASLLASLAGLCDVDALSKVAFVSSVAASSSSSSSPAPLLSVLEESLRLLQAVCEAAGPQLRRFRSHMVAVLGMLFAAQSANSGDASSSATAAQLLYAEPVCSLRYRVFASWLRSVGPGLPSEDTGALFKTVALHAASCIVHYCTGSAGSLVPNSAATTASEVMHDLISTAWFHLSDATRLVVERTVLQAIGASASAAGNGGNVDAERLRNAALASVVSSSSSFATGTAMDEDGGEANEAGDDEDDNDDEEEDEELELPQQLSGNGRYFKGKAGKFFAQEQRKERRLQQGAGSDDNTGIGPGSKRMRLSEQYGAASGAASSGPSVLSALVTAEGGHHKLLSALHECVGSPVERAASSPAYLVSAKDTSSSAPTAIIMPQSVLESLARLAVLCASVPWKQSPGPSPLQNALLTEATRDVRMRGSAALAMPSLTGVGTAPLPSSFASAAPTFLSSLYGSDAGSGSRLQAAAASHEVAAFDAGIQAAANVAASAHANAAICAPPAASVASVHPPPATAASAPAAAAPAPAATEPAPPATTAAALPASGGNLLLAQQPQQAAPATTSAPAVQLAPSAPPTAQAAATSAGGDDDDDEFPDIV